MNKKLQDFQSKYKNELIYQQQEPLQPGAPENGNARTVMIAPEPYSEVQDFLKLLVDHKSTDKKQEKFGILVQEELEFRKAFQKLVNGNQNIQLGIISILLPMEVDMNASNI